MSLPMSLCCGVGGNRRESAAVIHRRAAEELSSGYLSSCFQTVNIQISCDFLAQSHCSGPKSPALSCILITFYNVSVKSLKVKLICYHFITLNSFLMKSKFHSLGTEGPPSLCPDIFLTTFPHFPYTFVIPQAVCAFTMWCHCSSVFLLINILLPLKFFRGVLFFNIWKLTKNY